jgi:hypothetical protein
MLRAGRRAEAKALAEAHRQQCGEVLYPRHLFWREE